MGALSSLVVLAPLTALSLALVAILPLDPSLTYGFQRITTSSPAGVPITPADGLPYTRRTIHFDSQGTACEAWLYTPAPLPPASDPAPEEGAAAPGPAAAETAAVALKHPVVIMAHGLGAQKDLGLHRFADAFAREGMAVLVFDYRTFGGSDGEPRHWASPRRHIEDWRAALQFVKVGSLGPEYDTDRVALWGTSFAGGHVLVVGAEQPPNSVSCVMAMVPHLDGLETSRASVRRRGLPGSLRLVAAGIHDKTRHALALWLERLGMGVAPDPAADGKGARGHQGKAGPLAPLLRHLTPAYIKLVGTEDEMALMQLSPQELQSYFGKHPKVYEGGWQPRVLARLTLETSAYRPITSVPRLSMPVLFVSATRDGLCPPHLVRQAAALLPNSANSTASNSTGGSSNSTGTAAGGGSSLLLELDCTHFDAYHGEHFQAAADAMVAFARGHLLGKEGAGAGGGGAAAA